MMDEKIDNQLTPSLFSLYDEKFSLKWLFRYGFYRILWFGLLAKFNVVSVNKKEVISYLSPTIRLHLAIMNHVVKMSRITLDLYQQKQDDMEEFRKFREAHANILCVDTKFMYKLISILSDSRLQFIFVYKSYQHAEWMKDFFNVMYSFGATDGFTNENFNNKIILKKLKHENNRSN